MPKNLVAIITVVSWYDLVGEDLCTNTDYNTKTAVPSRSKKTRTCLYKHKKTPYSIFQQREHHVTLLSTSGSGVAALCGEGAVHANEHLTPLMLYR